MAAPIKTQEAAVLARCERFIRTGNGHVSFARLNDDSTWTFEITEVMIVARTMMKKRYVVKVDATKALFFLGDMMESAKTEANYGGKL